MSYAVTQLRSCAVDGAASTAEPRNHGTAQPVLRRKTAGQHGFTLIEMIVVVTIIGILAATAMVAVRNYQRKALETALRDDLTQMRKAIDNFYADKQRYPNDLNELVPNYLRKVPVDPITKQVDWQTVQDQPQTDDTSSSTFDTTATDMSSQGPGIVDVKCSAPGKTLDNVPYSDL